MRGRRPETAGWGYEDEARISEFQGLVYRLRKEAGLTQAELAERMGTTQSTVARMEGGGTGPTVETLEKLAAAVEQEMVVGFGEGLSGNRSIARLVSEGRGHPTSCLRRLGLLASARVGRCTAGLRPSLGGPTASKTLA